MEKMIETKEMMKTVFIPSRVTETLHSIFHYPLTIVEAPMGYGKTTAVKEYLESTNTNILYHRVFDNSVSNFWNGLCRLFNKFDNDRAQMLSKMGFPDENMMVYDVLNIIEEIELIKKTVIVIDDFHLINNEAVNFFIEALVKNEVSDLYIVLATRYTDFQNMEELKLKGYLNHITKDNLEFTPKEIIQYYKTCGINLTDVDANDLYAYTEGWISAIYLLMLNYRDIENLQTTGSIYKLIEKAIYVSFSNEAKDLLLTMCIFDRFTLEQAAFMCEHKNTQQLIDEITQKNAFINFDSVTKTFQIHNIFTNFLKEIMETKNLKEHYYEKAAQWYLKSREYLEAMYYFYMCRNFDQLLSTIEIDKGNSFNGENKDLLIDYMTACPDYYKLNHHMSLLVYAMHLFTFNQMDLFEKVCNDFICNLKLDTEISEMDMKELLGEFELLMSFTVYNDIRKMSKHHKRACHLLTSHTSIYDTRTKWTFGSFSVLYMFYRETGKLEQLVKDMFEAKPYYDQLTDGHGSGGEYLLEAERYFYTGDFENAEIWIHKTLNKAQINGASEIILCAEILQIRLAFFKGDYAYVYDHLTHMRKDIKYRTDYFHLHTIEVFEGYMYALLKQNDKIPERMVSGDMSSSRLMFPAYALINMVYGRVLLIQEDYLKLIGNADQFTELASVFPNLLALIHTQIYLAAANEKINRHQEALVSLREALDMAMPDKLYIPFVENSDYIQSLLKEIQKEGQYIAEIDAILVLTKRYQNSVKQMNQDCNVKIRPKLSQREHEIAVLAAEGLTNKEISEKLYISQNTIKTQLKTIFEKLGINSRALLKQALT